MTGSIVKTVLTRLKAAMTSANGLACVLGVALGCYTLAIYYQYVATFGSTLPFLAAALIAAAVGCELGLRKSTRPAVQSNSFASFAISLGLLTCWVIAFPGLVLLVVSCAGWFDVRTMSQVWVTACYAGCSAHTLLALPMFWVVRVASYSWASEQTSPGTIEQRRSRNAARWCIAGFVLGLVVDALLLATYIGVQFASWLAVALSALPIFGCWRILRSDHSAAVAAVSQTEASPTPADVREQWTAALRRIVLIVALGAAFAVLTRMMRQLMPGMTYIVCGEWAALITGILVGRIWVERSLDRGNRRTSPALSAGLMSAAWVVCVLAAFPWLVGLMLELNASVSQVALLQSARLLSVCSLILPIGLAWGALSRQHVTPEAQSQRRRGRLDAGLSPLAFVAGLLVCRGLAIPEIGVPATSLAIACWLSVVGVLSALWDAHTGRIAITGWPARVRPGTRLGQAGFALCLVLVAAAPIWRGNYDPARSARLLFSSTVSTARAMGFHGDTLDVLDEGRLVATAETSRSTYTLWKHYGSQLQLREDGIPKAVSSTDPHVFPHYTAELLPAVLPLVLHERPHRVLLLGLRGGLPLLTALDFPVIHVSCAESDSRLRELVETAVWPASARPRVEDGRLQWLGCTPTLALTCRDVSYDVIVSSPDQAAFPHAAPCYTAEFYRRAASRLSENGIFCQRFACIDFGPEPLRVVARTMSTAFEHVAAVETAPGELVLLGTNGSEGLVREGLVERCQAPQVRHALSQLGWDWVVPLNLSACGRDKLVEFVEESTAPPNTARNGSFAFRLPQEIMRWGAKQQEVYEQLAHRSESLLVRGATDAEDPDVLKRLAEVTAQRRLMADSADEYWAYRSVVRKQVTQRPRSVIRQVSGKAPRQTLHPQAKRRMRYFQMLGKALKSPKPDVAQIQQVASFSQPYDPLVSFFLHDEVAQLYARLDGAAPAAELVHRLHSVYYADPADRSVRNVIATINLLNSHPEATTDSQTRWDHLNALLQVLKGRWETRAGSPPGKAHVALVDVDRSAEAVENTFALMDDLSNEVEVDESYWPARRAYLERTLMRPLRTYRRRLLPHHLKEARQKDREQNDKLPNGNETADSGELGR